MLQPPRDHGCARAEVTMWRATFYQFQPQGRSIDDPGEEWQPGEKKKKTTVFEAPRCVYHIAQSSITGGHS